ncbi:hypothetical protein E2C01_041877 [Portunus trituberculatus]|uniref:Uncharacterized protein n=1 Tax=Portunus trituberculatus TaxID=210409 RepID=A0A5B7FKC9_PORTR|nr:hypothetical protein [Portunus trituberculatus]
MAAKVSVSPGVLLNVAHLGSGRDHIPHVGGAWGRRDHVQGEAAWHNGHCKRLRRAWRDDKEEGRGGHERRAWQFPMLRIGLAYSLACQSEREVMSTSSISWRRQGRPGSVQHGGADRDLRRSVADTRGAALRCELTSESRRMQ